MMFYFIDCRIKNIAKLHDNSQTDELLWIKMGNNMSFVGALSAWSYLQKGNRSRFGVIYVMCGSHEMLVETDKFCYFVNGRMCTGGAFRGCGNIVGNSFYASPLICCDRFEIYRSKGFVRLEAKLLPSKAEAFFSPHRQVTGSSAFDYKQIFVSCYTLSGIKMCIFWA